MLASKATTLHNTDQKRTKSSSTRKDKSGSQDPASAKFYAHI